MEGAASAARFSDAASSVAPEKRTERSRTARPALWDASAAGAAGATPVVGGATPAGGAGGSVRCCSLSN